MNQRTKEILIVEDDPGMGILLKRQLEKSGFSVKVEKTGRGVIEALQDYRPDLLLLDLGLPDITGRELLNLLTEKKSLLPFVVVSGVSESRLIVEMMQYGALDFIIKDSQLLDLVVPIVNKSFELIETKRLFDEAQDKLTHISEAINDVFWMRSIDDGKVLYVSPAYEAIWGEEASLLYNNSEMWVDSIIEKDKSKYIRGFEKLKEGYGSHYDEVYRIRDKMGEVRWIRDRGYVAMNQNDDALYLTGVATEITKYKKLESRLLEISEKERMRIGQDLHDDLCQRLAALKLKCGLIHKSLKEEEHKQCVPMEQVVTDLDAATSLTRKIAKGLSPVSFEAEGLVVALEQLADTTSNLFGVICQFDCPEMIDINDPTTASHIYRIAQELTNNAAKHARPTRIHIGLYNSLGGICLEVTNDGLPFSDNNSRKNGMGLHLIQYRADAIGASLEYFPGALPDGGTRAMCMIPQSENKNLSDKEK